MIRSLPSLVKGSGKQSSFSSQWRVRPRYGKYRTKEWSVSHFKFKIWKYPCQLYGKKWHRVDVLAMRFIRSLRPECQAGESAAIWVIIFTFQEQLSSLNVKKNHCSAPLVGTLSRVVQLMLRNHSSAYDVWAANAVHVRSNLNLC